MTRPEVKRYKLMPRDIEILVLVGRMGQATSKQLCRCFFRERSTGHRRFAKLVALGFLDVSVTHPEEPNIFTLSSKGLTLLVDRGVAPEQLHRSRVGRHADLHAQYINDLRIEFALAIRGRSDVALEAFHGDLDLRRRAGKNPPSYIPDAIVELSLPEGPLALVLEIDTGTEGQSVVESKIATTVELWRTKRRCWGAEPGTWRPAICVPTAVRARSLARSITRVGGGELWLVSEFRCIAERGVLGPVFTTANDISGLTRNEPIHYRHALAPALAASGQEVLS